MTLQYISDSRGNITGVCLPIEEWNALKEKYKGIDDEIDVPDWHRSIVTERQEDYKKNKDSLEDFDDAINDIEKGL